MVITDCGLGQKEKKADQHTQPQTYRNEQVWELFYTTIWMVIVCCAFQKAKRRIFKVFIAKK